MWGGIKRLASEKDDLKGEISRRNVTLFVLKVKGLVSTEMSDKISPPLLEF